MIVTTSRLAGLWALALTLVSGALAAVLGVMAVRRG